MKIKFKILVCLSTLIFFSVSCGKVVQKSAEEEEEVPVFTAKFNVIVGVESNTSSNSSFSISDDFYTVVSGIKENKRSQLSWGKAIIEKTPVKPTESTNPTNSRPSFLYNSKSFNKNGIEITASDHTWIYGKYTLKKELISFSSKEIRRKYPRYLITAFTTQNNYQMKLIYDESVSGNLTYDLGALNDYETFLTTIQLITMETDIRDVYNELLPILYNKEFFSSLNYTFPKNKAMEFSLKRPIFIFDRSLELHLITLLDLASVDLDEAILFLNQLEEQLLPNNAKTVLLTTLKKLQTKSS
jgi:hypothetical protein